MPNCEKDFVEKVCNLKLQAFVCYYKRYKYNFHLCFQFSINKVVISSIKHFFI
jgi:hypothetical protein